MKRRLTKQIDGCQAAFRYAIFGGMAKSIMRKFCGPLSSLRMERAVSIDLGGSAGTRSPLIFVSGGTGELTARASDWKKPFFSSRPLDITPEGRTRSIVTLRKRDQNALQRSDEPGSRFPAH